MLRRFEITESKRLLMAPMVAREEFTEVSALSSTPIACCELEPEKRPPFSKTHVWLETIRAHLEANNPIPKNLLKNILDQNTKRPLSSLIFSHQPVCETPKDKN